jgi:hypothetical protein
MINKAFPIACLLSTLLVGTINAGESVMQKNEWSKAHLFDKQAKPVFYNPPAVAHAESL